MYQALHLELPHDSFWECAVSLLVSTILSRQSSAAAVQEGGSVSWGQLNAEQNHLHVAG